MAARSYLGLRINTRQLAAVSLSRVRGSFRLKGGRTLPLKKGVLSVCASDPNVLDPASFVRSLREVLLPLGREEDPVALSLPDASGKTLVTSLPVSIKSKAEGVDLLKFELKKQLPIKPSETHLDYQILERTAEGGSRVLVSLVAKTVLDQYEELMGQAGFFPASIGFQVVDLYSYYRSRLDFGEEFGILSVSGDNLSLQFYQGGIVTYIRTTRIEESHFALGQEISLTLPRAQDSGVSPSRSCLYVHSDWEDPEGSVEALSCVYGGPVRLLSPELDRISSSALNLPAAEAASLVCAIGSAERLF